MHQAALRLLIGLQLWPTQTQIVYEIERSYRDMDLWIGIQIDLRST